MCTLPYLRTANVHRFSAACISEYNGPIQQGLPAVCAQFIDTYVLCGSDVNGVNGGDGLAKLTGLLKHFDKAKARRPSVLKLLEEVHKTAQTDPKNFSPEFNFNSITLECAAGKCRCAKPQLLGAPGYSFYYGDLSNRFWSGLQTYITYHCQHSKGATSLEAVRQVAIFAYESLLILAGSFTAVSVMSVSTTGWRAPLASWRPVPHRFTG